MEIVVFLEHLEEALVAVEAVNLIRFKAMYSLELLQLAELLNKSERIKNCEVKTLNIKKG